MISLLGNGIQIVAMVMAVISSIVLVFGAKARREGLVNAGYLMAFGTAGALTLAVAIILTCFLTENFHLAYVVSNYPATDSPLKPLYLVSAGTRLGREGSLLLWTWLIALSRGPSRGGACAPPTTSRLWRLAMLPLSWLSSPRRWCSPSPTTPSWRRRRSS